MSLGKYNTHEKRKIALKNYLEEFNIININNIVCKRLYNNFKFYKDDIYETSIELGYDIIKIVNQMPKNYYNNHPKYLKQVLIDFTNEYKRFPTIKEMQEVLKINSHFIKGYGGLDSFKKLINYCDKDDLIDLRSDHNKSLAELYIANFLCNQGLTDYYKREQYPFPTEEGRYRSDFSFTLENGKELHIEVWGVYKNSIKSKIHVEYNKVRKIKENLYKKYNDNIILIGIDYEVFINKYEVIQEKLNNLFSPYLNLDYEVLKYNQILSMDSITDKELFEECFKYNKNGMYFPTASKLLKDKHSGLYLEILKRGYSYADFVHKFGGILEKENLSWSKDLIYDFFNRITNAGKVINRKNINDSASNLQTAIQKFGGFTNLKLDFIDSLEYIPSQEIEWINDISMGKTKYNTKITKENIELAKHLLSKYNT